MQHSTCPTAGLTTERRGYFIRCTSLMTLSVATIITSVATAQPEPRSEDDRPGSDEAVQQRLNAIERELEQLRRQSLANKPANNGHETPRLLPETLHLGTSYTGANNGQRYLVVKLMLVNLTKNDWTVRRDDLKLIADGKRLPPGDIPKEIRYQTFVGPDNQSIRLQTLKLLESTTVPSMRSRPAWLFFGGLPSGNRVPSLILNVATKELTTDIDFNRFSVDDLRLKVDRIGPRGSLAVLHVGGMIDSINSGAIVDTLTGLAEQQVVRAIIHWTDNAPAVSSPTRNWLSQAALSVGLQTTVRNTAPFPPVPSSLRELHLAALPGNSGATKQTTSRTGTPARIHATLEDAAIAALQSVYQRVPLADLIHDVESDSQMTRVAALAGGGGRLPPEKLPMLLSLTHDDNPPIQRAAIRALGHFGEQEAVDNLVEHVRKNNEPLASDAIRSLAESRFGNAHQALLDVFSNEPQDGQARIAGVLAENPRPVWARTLYDYLTSSGAQPLPEVLSALAKIGHPKLTPLLERTLKSPDTKLRDQAFSILAGQTDEDSERIAVEFTIGHMERNAPTSIMLSLLNRTRDQRAVPLLVRRLETGKSNRTQIITALAQIGDQTIAEPIVRLFDQLQDSEKSAALDALTAVGASEYRALAGRSLLSQQSSLVRAAATGLQNDGSPEAVELLGEALQKASSSNGWQYMANALAMLGTLEARAHLYKVRETANDAKRTVVLNAIRSAQRRSPGYSLVYQGNQARRNKKWKQALELYSQAIGVDDRLSDAWFGRANVHLKQDDGAKALADFDQGLKIDPLNSTAVTGRGLALVAVGQPEKGVRFVEESRSDFERDSVFAYNSACVYSQAAETVDDSLEPDDRAARIKALRGNAIEELRRSVKLGFRNFEVMRDDEDLKPLRDLPEFRQIARLDDSDDADAAQDGDR